MATTDADLGTESFSAKPGTCKSVKLQQLLSVHLLLLKISSIDLSNDFNELTQETLACIRVNHCRKSVDV